MKSNNVNQEELNLPRAFYEYSKKSNPGQYPPLADYVETLDECIKAVLCEYQKIAGSVHVPHQLRDALIRLARVHR